MPSDTDALYTECERKCGKFSEEAPQIFWLIGINAGVYNLELKGRVLKEAYSLDLKKLRSVLKRHLS